VEDVEIGVLDPSLVKIGRGEGLSIKGGGVFPITLVMNTNKMSIFIDTPVTDVSGGFCLSFLVKEDDGIEVRLSTIIPYPSFTRVVGVLKVASKWGSEANRFRRGSGSSNGRLVLSEADRLVTVDTVVVHVWLSEVKNARDKE